MLKIRLRRMGSRHRPFYRVVVSDQRRVPSATALDEIGYYDPRKRPTVLQIDLERFEHWVGQGAQPSDTVKRLAKRVRNHSDSLAAVGEAVEASARHRTDEDVAEAEAALAASADAETADESTEAAEASSDEAAEASSGDEASEAPAAEAAAEETAAEEAAAEEPAAEETAAEETAAEEATAEADTEKGES
ncbi:MAG: 30S ribosomal protein S16 [Acidobacteriota bacterium]